MFRIILKDIQRIKLILVAFPVLAIGVILTAHITTNKTLYFLLPLLSLILPLLSLLSTESAEDHYRGYKLLKKMPLTLFEIISSKYLLSFTLIITTLCFLVILHQFIQPLPPLIFGVQLLSTNITLILTGISYILIYKIGYIKFLNIFKIISMSTLIIPQMLLLLLLKNKDTINIDKLFTTIFTPQNWIIPTLLTLILFTSSFILSLKIHHRK